MNPLVTHPGKLGDLTWALATVRALAGAGRVDLLVGAGCARLEPFLRAQPYVGEVIVHPDWHVTGDRYGCRLPPRHPALDGGAYHLGLKDWPTPCLFHYYPRLLKQEYGVDVRPAPDEPWLEWERHGKPGHPVIAFTDEYAEQKAGLVWAITAAYFKQWFHWLFMPGSRTDREWSTAVGTRLMPHACDVRGLAERIANARFVIACKSFPYVLACGLGVPVVVLEPHPLRRDPVFDFPGGRNIVLNGDPTFHVVDAREAVAAVATMLERTA